MKRLSQSSHVALVGLSAALLLGGCTRAGSPPGSAQVTDTDGDTFSDAFELAIGTDPESDDSDGDGFTDAEEYTAYYDPDDDFDFPRAGDYPRQAWPRDIEDGGTDVGQVLNDFVRVDQYNEDISLHEFYGNVVVIGVGADW